jgi:heat shock protein HslJ
MRNKLLFIGLLLLACILLVTSCTIKTMETELTGTSWMLVSLKGQPLIEDTEITLVFRETYLEGTMGCNGYGGGPDSGAYTATERGKFSLGEFFAVTVQLCAEPEGIMEQEDAYIKALRSVSAYEVSNDRLMLNNADGETILVYRLD